METIRPGTDWYSIDNASAVGSTRRAAVRLAQRLDFDEGRVGDVGIVVSEIAANLWKHATGAVLGIQVALRRGEPGVRVVATDRGPGMTDVDLSALDGHSTSGTLGVGLGAVLRLSSTVDISSQAGRGTVLVADLWRAPIAPDEPGVIEIAGLTRPITGEEVCGDAVGAREIDGRHLVIVSDGLGHGPLAADASSEALTAFHTTDTPEPGAMVSAIHRRLQGTRGAAVGVAAFGGDYRSVSFAGVGNISAFVAGPERRSAALCQPGIVGHQLPRVRTIELPLDDDAVLVMHSDGVRETWNLRDSPGLSRRAPAVIAGTVLRDAGNRPDDASVLVARRRR